MGSEVVLLRHIIRRGNVYAVRFRIPADLQSKLGFTEFQRSLHTSDPREARRRGQLAITWFWTTLERLRAMTNPTRLDLENSARRQFLAFTRQHERPRDFPLADFANAVAWQIETSEAEMRDLDVQLVQNNYDAGVKAAARNMLDASGISDAGLWGDLADYAHRLAARALREGLRHLVHGLEAPVIAYEPEDALFAEHRASEGRPPLLASEDVETINLETAIKRFLTSKREKGNGASSLAETERLCGWMCERFAADVDLSKITKADLRNFRDDLRNLSSGFQGQALSFTQRLTDDPARRLKAATSGKYWGTVQDFFRWCCAEGYLETDPSVGLRIEKPKAERPRTPEPFSTDEVHQFLNTPLFQGRLSVHRQKDPGSLRQRDGYWWAPVLLMYTGMRAGELSQLLPSDFDFRADVPHVKVRETDDEGAQVKSVKNEASIRDVPLHPDLLALGLQQFVEGRAKRHAGKRVFFEFRMGGPGRLSDGITQFSRRYLKAFDLHKPGRANHVWRHTTIARLRAANVAEEDIQSLVGHSRGTITARYGGDQPLSRKAATIKSLSYGFDVVEALGGPFQSALHQCA